MLGGRLLTREYGTSENRQHDSTVLHKQIRGHSLSRAKPAHESAVAVVSGEEYSSPLAGVQNVRVDKESCVRQNRLECSALRYSRG